MATINDLRQVIEHCPPPNDQQPFGLLGWTVDDGHVCAKCASRIIGRGCGTMLKGAEAIWEQSDKMCSLCFQIMKEYRGIKPLN